MLLKKPSFWIKAILLAALIVFMILSQKVKIEASSSYQEGVPYQIMATAYTSDEGAVTATGTELNLQTAAFDPQYYGWVAMVYTMDMEFIGMYQIEDTGAHWTGVRIGEVIDLWMPTKNQADEFGRQDVIVYFVNGKG